MQFHRKDFNKFASAARDVGKAFGVSIHCKTKYDHFDVSINDANPHSKMTPEQHEAMWTVISKYPGIPVFR